MVMSSSLNRLDVMVAMARAVRGIPHESFVFIQYPVLDADPARYAGRVSPHPTLAPAVMELLSFNEPFTVADGSLGFGSTSGGDEGVGVPRADDVEVLEGVVGQTAGDETCAVPRT